jgi:hypothetical protein
MTRLRKFLSLPAPDKKLFTEACAVHGLARFGLLVLPFKWIAPILGKPTQETSAVSQPEENDLSERVRWAVNAAGRHGPWKSTCLIEAITAKLMLRRRGIPSTLYLGAGRDENRKICYHAWLRSGGSVVAGGPIDKAYTVLTTFTEPGK